MSKLSNLGQPFISHQPTHVISNLENLSVDDPNDVNRFIRDTNIRGITYNLDQTVKGLHDTEPSVAMLGVFERFYSGDVKQGFIINDPSRERTEHAFDFARTIVKLTGIRLELVFSQYTGFYKPEKAIFLLAALQMDLKPEQMAHVGSHSARDIKAANKAGYSATIQVAPYAKSIQVDAPADKKDTQVNPAALHSQRLAKRFVSGFVIGMPIHSANFPENLTTLRSK